MADVAKERDIWVHSFRLPADTNATIKMEVGIEDCLHIEFEYNKSKCVCFPRAEGPAYSRADILNAHRYHLKDVIVGKIYFLLVRIKIKHMELSIIRRETTGSPPNQYNESETITKFEIMDGAPVRGACYFLLVWLLLLYVPSCFFIDAKSALAIPSFTPPSFHPRRR